MAIRFRRRVKIAPGLTWNLGKKSASVRAGGRGFGVTLGTAGKRVTMGLPGTGLSYSAKVNGKPGNAAASVEKAQPQKSRAFGWLIGLAAVTGLVLAVTAFTA